eukprot:4644105-Amphidinium_carterae.2
MSPLDSRMRFSILECRPRGLRNPTLSLHHLTRRHNGMELSSVLPTTGQWYFRWECGSPGLWAQAK